jgi:hypothetical protein
MSVAVRDATSEQAGGDRTFARVAAHLWMLYCGNDYGRDGLGLARFVPSTPTAAAGPLTWGQESGLRSSRRGFRDRLLRHKVP